MIIVVNNNDYKRVAKQPKLVTKDVTHSEIKD